jgi:hypothetical protein
MLQAVTPFEWLNQHIQMIGWGTIISFIAWLWWKSIRLASISSSVLTNAKDRFEVVEKNINVVATNHLDHIQQDMSEMNEKQSTMLTAQADGNKSLSDIATGIAVLVDRPR